MGWQALLRPWTSFDFLAVWSAGLVGVWRHSLSTNMLLRSAIAADKMADQQGSNQRGPHTHWNLYILTDIKHLRGCPYNYSPPTRVLWVVLLAIEYPRRPLFCSSFAIPCWQKIRRPYTDMPARPIKHHMTVNKLSTEAHDMTTAGSRCFSHTPFLGNIYWKSFVSKMFSKIMYTTQYDHFL